MSPVLRHLLHAFMLYAIILSDGGLQAAAANARADAAAEARLLSSMQTEAENVVQKHIDRVRKLRKRGGPEYTPNALPADATKIREMLFRVNNGAADFRSLNARILIDALIKYLQHADKFVCPTAEVTQPEAQRTVVGELFTEAARLVQLPQSSATQLTQAQTAFGDFKITVQECASLRTAIIGDLAGIEDAQSPYRQVKGVEDDTPPATPAPAQAPAPPALLQLKEQVSTAMQSEVAQPPWATLVKIVVAAVIAVTIVWAVLPTVPNTIKLRMWTAARPCTQTTSYLGYVLAQSGTRRLHVSYGYDTVTNHWYPAVDTYAQHVTNNNGFAQLAAAVVPPATRTNMYNRCFTFLAAMNEDVAEEYDATSALPVGAAGAGLATIGTINARSCAELCAFTLAGINRQASCSTALVHTGNRNDWRAVISVSGPATAAPQVAGAALPANVNPTINGAPTAVPLIFVATPLANLNVYDTCRLTDRITNAPKNKPESYPCSPIDVLGQANVPARLNRAWSRLGQIDAWTPAIKPGAKVVPGAYPNPDPPTPPVSTPYIQNHMALKGFCSEDKAIAHVIPLLEV